MPCTAYHRKAGFWRHLSLNTKSVYDFLPCLRLSVALSSKPIGSYEAFKYGGIIFSLTVPLCLSDLPDISISHSNLTVIEGDRVTAICNGSGSPLPEVDWPVNGLHSINAQEVRRTHTHVYITNRGLSLNTDQQGTLVSANLK